MVKKLLWILRNYLSLIQVVIKQSLVALSISTVNIHPFIGFQKHGKTSEGAAVISKKSKRTKTLKLKEPLMKRAAFKTQ